jgi:hypothetical protein
MLSQNQTSMEFCRQSSAISAGDFDNSIKRSLTMPFELAGR